VRDLITNPFDNVQDPLHCGLWGIDCLAHQSHPFGGKFVGADGSQWQQPGDEYRVHDQLTIKLNGTPIGKNRCSA
jgi:hypothetical protein